MSLDLGQLIAHATIETVAFDRGAQRILRVLSTFGTQADKASSGVRVLDDSLVAAGGSATKASASIDRASAAAQKNAAAAEKAAAAQKTNAAATSQVNKVMAQYAGESARVQAAALRVAAAQDRLEVIQRAGVATTRQLASAQATLIGAQRSLAAAQEAGAVSGGRFRTSVAGTLRTVGELGILIGGIELAKKAIEFAGAGKDLTTSLNSVQAAAQATDQEMVAVRSEAIGLGKDLTVPAATAVDAADAIDDLVRAGMTLPRAMAAARYALLLAAAAGDDTAFSARVLGDVLDEFQMPASKAADVASKLGAAATGTAGGLQTIFDAMRYAGTRARAANIPLDDLLATIMDLSKAGLQGTNIGTGLAMAIQKLAAPSGSGAKALQDLGIEAWDAQGRFKGLSYVVGQVFEAKKRFGADSQRFLGDISKVFGARAANAIAAFAGKGVEGLDRFQKRIDSFNLQHAADTMNRGLGAAAAQIRKQLTAVGIDVYTKLEPALVSAGVWLGTKLPHDIGVLASILGPTVHLVGEGLGGAWTVVVGVLHAAEAVLGPVVHFLQEHEGLTTGVATGVLSMWAAWKLWTIARVAIMGVGNLLSGLGTRMAATALVPAKLTAAVDTAAVNTQLAALRMGASWESIAAKADASAAAAGVAGIKMAGAAKVAAVGVDEAGAAASAGWASMLGPLAAIGLGVTLLTTMFHSNDDAVKQTAADLDDYAASVNRSKDALSAINIAQTNDLLAKKGALLLLDHLHTGSNALGISYDDLTSAVNGSDKQFSALKTTLVTVAALHAATGDDMDAQGKAASQLFDIIQSLRGGLQGQIQTQHDLNKVSEKSLNITNGQASAAAALYGLTGSKGVAAYLAATKAARDSTAQTRAQTLAFQAENDAASLLQQALDGLAGINLAVASARTASASSLRALNKAFKDNGSAIGDSTKKGIANQQAVQQQVQIDQQLAAAIGKKTKSTSAEILSLRQSRDAALAAADAQGVLTPRVQAYIDKLYNVKGVSAYLSAHPTKLDVNPAPAITGIAAVEHRLALLHDKTVTIHYNTTTGGHTLPGSAGGRAQVPEGVSAVGERGTELLVKDGSKLGVVPHGPAMSFLRATGARIQGFAGGTKPNPITTGTSDGKKVWIYAGIRYASLAAAQNAETRATTQTPAEKRKAAHDHLKGGRGTVAGFRHIGRLLGDLTSTRSDFASVFGSIYSALRDAGASRQFVRGLKKEDDAILAAVGKRDKAAKRLAIANQALANARKVLRTDRHAFAGAVVGSFDITSAGADANGRVTRGGIVAADNQAVTRARAFVAGMKKLIGLKVFPNRYLRSLLGQGPAALAQVQALAGMPRAELVQLANDNRQLSKLGNQIGTLGAGRLDQGRVDAAQKQVNHWQKIEDRREQRLENALDRFANRIENKLGDLHMVGKLGLTKGELALIVDTGRSQNAHRTRSAPPRPGGRP